MGKFAGLAGWAIFAIALFIFLFHHGPDDMITAQLKTTGLYIPLVVAVSAFDGLGLIYLAFFKRSRRTAPPRRDFKRNGR
jgi:hypothetical protein